MSLTNTKSEAAPGLGMSDPPPVEESEAIVIGSGFGGAVAACRMAQAGIKVLVIERGRRYESQDFPALPTDSALLPDLARWTWQQSQGLWDVVDLDEMLSVQAAGYGGGSLIYANVHLRPPSSVFDHRWPTAYRNGKALEDFYNLAAFMLDVAPIDSHSTLSPAIVKSDQLRKVARHLGREDGFFLPPLAVSSRDGQNIHGREQKACNGCGSCCTGCPEMAKNTLDFNYLAVAEKHGARAVTQCEVIDIEQTDCGAWTLSCTDHLAGGERVFRTKNLFLCAGSVHSTRLLARARMKTPGQLAQSLAGIGYFANADAIGMVYDTTHPQYPSFGPTITTSTVCRTDATDFFLIQDGGYSKALERLTGVPRAPAWLGRNRLTKVIPATVGASQRPAPHAPAPPSAGLALLSPFDDVLNAIAGGAFHAVTSPGARSDWAAFMGELKAPLLIPSIVDRTIDSSLRQWLARSRLTAWLKPKGWAITAIVRFNRWLIRKIYGTDSVIADRALEAMLTGASLPPTDIAKRVMGYDDQNPDNRLMLLAMGCDASPGVLHYDRRRDRMIADLDLYHLIPRYTEEEQVMSEISRALGGELRTNPAWAFMGKPISVHNQGGCPMSEKPTDGVTTPDGRVHGCDGLYILDGSVLCTSVGVNPSATIAAVAERNILSFIRAYKRNNEWPEHDTSPGACEYKAHREGASAWTTQAILKNWTISPPKVAAAPLHSEPLGLEFKEVMQGYYSPTTAQPVTTEEYRQLETCGRPIFPLKLDLSVSVENLARLFEDHSHVMQLMGSVNVRLPDDDHEQSYPATGQLDLFVKRHKPYGITPDQKVRRSAQERLLNSRPYTTTVGEPDRREKRQMTYALKFEDRAGRPWTLHGHKNIRDDPGLDAWRDTSSLFVTLVGPPAGNDSNGVHGRPPVVRGGGVAHVDFDGFLYHQLPSMRITPVGVDPARAMWARIKFASFFFGTLQRIYLPEARSALEALFKLHPNNVSQEQPKRAPWPTSPAREDAARVERTAVP